MPSPNHRSAREFQRLDILRLNQAGLCTQVVWLQNLPWLTSVGLWEPPGQDAVVFIFSLCFFTLGDVAAHSFVYLFLQVLKVPRPPCLKWSVCVVSMQLSSTASLGPQDQAPFE